MNEQDKPEIDPPFDTELDDDVDEIDIGPAEFDPASINIQPKPDSLRNLIERLRHEEIDMNTDFQRHADLWSNAQMSRLIESILIRFPVPPFYFDATKDEKWLVIDGLQRLSAIRKFVIEKKLRLSKMEYLKELNGKSYDELDRQFQRRIDEYPVSLYLILPGTETEVKYSIFRRINTGGLTLNNQEIRNAMATPRERKFLTELTKNSHFVDSVGDQSKRMADQELVLRFLAFYTQDYKNSRKNIAVFIDETMEKLKKSTYEELDKFKHIFDCAISCCNQIFGNRAFEKKTENGNNRIRKNASLFEALMVCIAKLPEPQRKTLVEKKTQFSAKLLDLTMDDQKFNEAISFATQKHEHVDVRHQRVTDLIKEVCQEDGHA
jgi:hypothetical protein